MNNHIKNNNLIDPQTGFQFKNIGSNKKTGTLLIVLMFIMSVPIAVISFFSGVIIGLLVSAISVFLTIFAIVCGVRLIKKDKEIDKRILESMYKYSRGELEWEIQNNLVCMYQNAHNQGTVYFTGRLIICTGQGAFTYDEIRKIHVFRSHQKYAPDVYLLNITDKNGSEIDICRCDGKREEAAALYNQFIFLCTSKNNAIQVEAEGIY